MTEKNENTQKILKMIKELVELLGTTLATDIKDLTPPRDLKAGDEAMSYAQQNPAPREYKTPFVESRPINPPGTTSGNVRNVSTCTIPDKRRTDTVNIRGEHLRIDISDRDRTSSVNQAEYLKDLAVVLTAKQLEELHALALKSNQQHTPALWLNQAIAIELTASSIFSLIKPASRITEARGPGRTVVQTTSDSAQLDSIERILGTILFEKLRVIAEATELAASALFQVIVAKIIADREFKPVPTIDMWNQAKKLATPESDEAPVITKPKRVRKPAPKKAASRKAAQKAPEPAAKAKPRRKK